MTGESITVNLGKYSSLTRLSNWYSVTFALYLNSVQMLNNSRKKSLPSFNMPDTMNKWTRLYLLCK